MIITVPPSPNYVIAAFICCGLVFWAVVWGFVALQLVAVTYMFGRGVMLRTASPSSIGAFSVALLFFGAWLAMWTSKGSSAIAIVTFNLSGVQRLEFLDDGLTSARSCMRWQRTTRYVASAVTNLRPDSYEPKVLEPYATCLSFDSGAKSVDVLIGVNEAEIREMLRAVAESSLLWKEKIAPKFL